MKETGYKDSCFIGFFNIPENSLTEKVILMNRIANQYKMCYKRKLGCFTGFYHYRLTTMSAHTHAYQYTYPLFESGTKTGL